MRARDLLQFGLANLWRTKLRTILTTLGVIIGIGALVAMVSFGTGMQKNMTSVFYENDLFTSMRVMPMKIDINQAMSGDAGAALNSLKAPRKALTDSTLQVIAAMPEVAIVFPEIMYPVKLRFEGQEAQTRLRAFPAGMGAYKPYKEPGWGDFFDNDSTAEIILTEWQLRGLKMDLVGSELPARSDTNRAIQRCDPDTLLGKEVGIVTSVLDVEKMAGIPLAGLAQPAFREQTTKLRLRAIIKSSKGFDVMQSEGTALVPLQTGKALPRFEFSNMWSLLSSMGGQQGGYSALYVRTTNLNQLGAVRKRVEAMGYGVIALADQLEQMKRGFIFVDAALGLVGTIALIVAALGIINTMVMSILERTREIGIMKAVGGSERQIKGIFFIEAGCIGLLGGVFGLLLGWVVTRIANLVANIYVARQGGPGNIEFFYLPPWLIFGALGFAVAVSLIAGLYPATRAARINPVEALRHD